MKKLIVILVGVAIAGGVIMSNAAAKKTETIKYRSAFDIQYAFCSIKTNGFVGQGNRNSAIAGRGFGASSTAAMVALENGDNEISVEFGGLNWFNPEIKDEKEKSNFNSEAYCNLEFVKIDGEKSDILSTISVSIDKDGKPDAKESNVTMQIRKERGVVPNYIPDDNFSTDYFPSGMPIYEFKKKVVVSGLPEWAWTKAEEYKDTSEQRSKLQKAYEALWQDFNRKDLNAIKSKLKIALNAWAYATDSNPDEIFNDYSFVSAMKNSDFKMLPIDWNGYDIKIMNKGRLVRLINKSDLDFSPILQHYNDNIATYAPTFSLINGEFVIVL